MENGKHKSRQLVSLFTAALLTLPLAGCGDQPDRCFDQNQDKRCDDDGSSYNPNNYVFTNGKRKAYLRMDKSHVSSGNRYKSGIGNHGEFFGG